MKLNRLGRAAMNNPVRSGIRTRIVAATWERLGGHVAGGRALEVRCRQGAAIRASASGSVPGSSWPSISIRE